MSIEEIATLILALGGGAFFREIGQGIIRLFTGRQAKEKGDLQEAIKGRREAQLERDDADAHRRILAEYASELRTLLIERGMSRDEIPPFPTRPSRKA